MFIRIKKYLKSETREMFFAISILIAICILFFLYLKFVGIPMSSAHNLFNQAVLELQQGNEQQARAYLEQSLAVRESREAREMLQELDQ